MEDIKAGNWVKTVYGDWYEVWDVRDNILYVHGLQQTVHISKIIAVR